MLCPALDSIACFDQDRHTRGPDPTLVPAVIDFRRNQVRWCSMSNPEIPLWWDRDVDHTGRSIRPDVRSAAHGIWSCAWRRAESLNCDCSQAAELMESTVSQVSRYLDRGGVLAFSREIDGLLMIAFQRTLYRRAAKLRRIETFGGPGELSDRAVDRKWAGQVHAQLELEQIVRLLSERSRTVLALRYAGYTWKEAAELLSVSVPALRSAFWRDIARVKSELNNHRSAVPADQVNRQQEIVSSNNPEY